MEQFKHKSDRDRMLAGSGSVPATGWIPVGEQFSTIAQAVIKQVFKVVNKAKSCNMSDIVLHIQIPGLASMSSMWPLER